MRQLGFAKSVGKLLGALDFKAFLHELREVPKNAEFVEVQFINTLDAVFEPAESQLRVAEVGLRIRIKRLHRFDAEVTAGKHRTELGCKNSLFRAFGEAPARPMHPSSVHQHHEHSVQGVFHRNGSEAKAHIFGVVVPHNGFG